MTHDQSPAPDAKSPHEPAAGEPEAEKLSDSPGEFAFQVFCAVIFLGMIGLVFYNAFLRYVFNSSFAPSEEWARFLFIFITFFGSIEAFYRNKHIAVDMFVGLTQGATRKSIDVIASLLALGVLFLLFWGGIVLVEQTMDTWSVATNINLGIINATLPIMAGAAFIIRGRDFIRLLKKPASEFKKPVIDFKKIAEEAKEG